MAKIKTASLFQILNSDPPSLVGIARMASHAQHANDGHLIEFKTLEVKSILNKSVSKRLLSLRRSINPYRGCELLTRDVGACASRRRMLERWCRTGCLRRQRGKTDRID